MSSRLDLVVCVEKMSRGMEMFACVAIHPRATCVCNMKLPCLLIGDRSTTIIQTHLWFLGPILMSKHIRVIFSIFPERYENMWGSTMYSSPRPSTYEVSIIKLQGSIPLYVLKHSSFFNYTFYHDTMSSRYSF